MSSIARKAANLSLDAALLSEARELDINLSRAAETGIADAVRLEKERRWQIDNAKAIEAHNAYVENNGLPLARFRQF